VDLLANAKVIGSDQRISDEKSAIAVWVIPVDEGELIASAVIEQI